MTKASKKKLAPPKEQFMTEENLNVLKRTLEANNNEGIENVSRSRYYGIRVGDRVKNHFSKIEKFGTVKKYGFADNNRVYVLWDGEDELHPDVAEHLTIIDKIEDLEDGKPLTPTPVQPPTMNAINDPGALSVGPQPSVSPMMQVATRELTQDIVTGQFKMELTKFRYEQAVQGFESLKVTEDNINEVQEKLKQGRGLIRKMDEMKGALKARAWEECKMWDKAFNDLSKPLDQRLSVLQQDLNRVAAEIRRKEIEAEQERQRVARIRDMMDNFIIEQSQAIAAAKTDTEIIRIEKLIGSNKANKSRYEEYLPEFVDRCNKLGDLIRTQKETIRELEKMAAQKAEAEAKQDDATILALQEKEAELEHKIEEGKVQVQETAINQAISTGAMEVARPIYPTAKARRTVWKAELLKDQKSLEKALKAGLLDVSLNKQSIDVLIDTLKETKQINVTDKTEITINGVRIYLEQTF